MLKLCIYPVREVPMDAGMDAFLVVTWTQVKKVYIYWIHTGPKLSPPSSSCLLSQSASIWLISAATTEERWSNNNGSEVLDLALNFSVRDHQLTVCISSCLSLPMCSDPSFCGEKWLMNGRSGIPQKKKLFMGHGLHERKREVRGWSLSYLGFWVT